MCVLQQYKKAHKAFTTYLKEIKSLNETDLCSESSSIISPWCDLGQVALYPFIHSQIFI